MEAAGASATSCGVCGRTMLAGETTRDYVSPEGETKGVCPLCKERAEQSGWTRADLPRRPPPMPPRERREDSCSAPRRLLRRRSRAHDAD
ncbi:MAG: hypothetical protein ACR2N5_03410, partial [Solirubrobacterales bacterium]